MDPYVKSVLLLVGLNGTDPLTLNQTLRGPSKEGPRGTRDLGGLQKGPEDGGNTATPEKEGVGVVFVIVVAGWSHPLTPGRDPPWFETIGDNWLFLETAWPRTVYVYPSAHKRTLYMEKRAKRKGQCLLGGLGLG